MEFKQVNQKYVDDAVELALAEYNNECEKCRQLISDNYKEKLKELVTELFKSKYGMVAIEDGKLIGYISFWEIRNGFFGNCNGVFSPLGGSAFVGKDRNKLASLLLEKVLQKLVNNEITSIAICRYAHDEETARSLVFNGFGIRCSDAIRDLNEAFEEKEIDKNICFYEIEKEEYKHIRELKKGLITHLSKAPIFFLTNLSNIEESLNDNTDRIFVAKDNDKIIGYIQVGDSGETFITENKFMKSICGTYLKPEYRNRNISDRLLHYVCNKLKEEGIISLGVDCETLNPTALRFWGKYFENYTYSFHRRIDERIVGYDKYLKNI